MKEKTGTAATLEIITRRQVMEDLGDLLSLVGNRNFRFQHELYDRVFSIDQNSIEVLPDEEMNKLWCYFKMYMPDRAQWVEGATEDLHWIEVSGETVSNQLATVLDDLESIAGGLQPRDRYSYQEDDGSASRPDCGTDN